MILLYEYTEEQFDIDGNSLGWDSEPRLFPNTFFLNPSLEFNWDELLVKYNEKWYYFGHLIDDLEKVPTKEEWSAKPGNDVDIEYYSDVVAEYQDNPSGNIKNTKRLTYLMNNKPKFIINFWYDKLDRVVKIRSIKGDSKAAESGVSYEEESQKVQDLTDLKTTPNYGVEVNETNIVTVKPCKNSVIVTAFEKIRPTNTDTIRIDDTTAKITVAYTSDNWTLTAYAYKEDSTLVSQVVAANKTLDVRNMDKNIKNLALVFFAENGISSLQDCEIEQIGCSVVLKPFVTLTKHNQNGENNSVSTEYAQDDVIEQLTDAYVSGAQFEGWFNSEANNASAVTLPLTMDSNKDIYAHFSCNLVKHNTDNKNNEVTEKTDKDAHIILTTPSLSGYDFDGWTLGQGGEKITEITMNTNKNIWAHWKKKQTTSGGDGGGNGQSGQNNG